MLNPYRVIESSAKDLSMRLAALILSTLVLAPCAASAGTATTGPKTVVNQSCQGRQLLKPGLDGRFDATELLDAAMKNRRFDHDEATSLASTQAMLVEYFGMRQSLRALPVDADRKAVARLSHLMHNNNVIAGQMALGALKVKNNLPAEMLRLLDTYVTNITEPLDDDEELTLLSEQIKRSIAMVEPMATQPRAFARWAMKAAAFEDGVAHDAAMIGFCSSNPSSRDTKLLKSALSVAKLDRSRTYKTPE